MYFDMGAYRITNSSIKLESNVWRELEIGNFYIDDIATNERLLQGTTLTAFTAVSTITLNKYVGDGTPTYSRNRWAYVKVYEAGNLVLDMIPVRKGNIGYMYDRVSRRLFANNGTG